MSTASTGTWRHLAACDLAVVQGGLTTTMDLTANHRPFLYFPLHHHFEQNFHVRHRLERYGAGRCVDFYAATPEVIAVAIEELSRASPNSCNGGADRLGRARAAQASWKRAANTKGGVNMMDRRSLLASAGAAVLAAGCASGKETSASAAHPKTYVLVHGAWVGGWCWKRVADRLRASGHQVYTPTQTGLGERSHLLSKDITLDLFTQDLVNVLEWEDLTDVVLVGHSFGGITITGVAERVPQRIRRLIYLDSFVLESGQSAFSVLPPEMATARRQLAQEFSGGVSMPPPDPKVLGVTDPADATWLKERCTPHPLSTYEDPMTLKGPVGSGLPVTYIAVKPHFGPTAASRALAQRQKGWQYLEIEAGHVAMVTSPKELTDVLFGF